MVMKTEHPWQELTVPTGPGVVNARRVDASLQRDFFWARDAQGKYLLLLRYGSDARPTGELPRLKAIGVEVYAPQAGEPEFLAFKLLDSSYRDIFERLCLDIVASSSRASVDEEAIQIALGRTWRWHHLLRGGGTGRLSPEEQKGLFGELLVLERVLIPNLPLLAAVSAWQGPAGAPKDYAIGRIAIEVKTHRGSATPFVSISSEHQLDSSGVDALFLAVIELDAAPAQSESGTSVCEAAKRIRDYIHHAAPAGVATFEHLVEAAGLGWDDDYTDTRWLEGQIRFYRVQDGFPRISADQISPGVSHVRYSISLLACQPHETDEADLIATLHSTNDVR
jgi:hypothetical protein